MGIESNASTDNTGQAYQPQGNANSNEGHTRFGAADTTTAPVGGLDVLRLNNMLVPQSISPEVKPYLDKILELVKVEIPDASIVKLERVQNAYAFKHVSMDGAINFFVIQFASLTEPKTQNLLPTSQKLRFASDELKARFSNEANVRILDGRVIIAGYEPEMARFAEMAAVIIRVIRVSTITQIKDVDVSVLQSSEFSVDWSLSAARHLESALSPHAVRPRMDVGMVLSAKLDNPMNKMYRDMQPDYLPIGVIGGYVEMREREPVVINGQTQLRYQPVFNVTVLNATIPLEGVASILMAAFAPSIYNSKTWLKQWSDLGENQPNPGNLVEDPDNKGRALALKNSEEVIQFAEAQFLPIHIAFQFEDGYDSIPGMFRMISPEPDQRNHFINRLARFYGAAEENAHNFPISQVVDGRIEGVYGDPSGTQRDSRDVDYFYVAAKNGVASISPEARRLLLGTGEDPTERAKYVNHITNSFQPLYFSTQAVINPDFFKWVVAKTNGRGIAIINPNQQVEARTLGSFTAGFGQAAGMGSVVSSGISGGRGLNLDSIWTVRQ